MRWEGMDACSPTRVPSHDRKTEGMKRPEREESFSVVSMTGSGGDTTSFATLLRAREARRGGRRGVASFGWPRPRHFILVLKKRAVERGLGER